MEIKLMKNPNSIFTKILLTLACFALSSLAHAVVPSPDGGYPGGNTAEGEDALLNLNVNTGTNNTAVGRWSLRSNVQGDGNTAIGSGTLLSNAGDGNTAIGASALLTNRTGIQNTAVGLVALRQNTTASYNTAIGASALFSNTTGFGNTATGSGALLNNTQGSDNTAFGLAALRENSTGSSNTASGVRALLFNTTGESNTATGKHALLSNTTGHSNTATGMLALASSNGGFENTATGYRALYGNTAGYGNTAIGIFALENSTTGHFNTALGYGAGDSITTAVNVICIGAPGVNMSNSCYIGSIWNQSGGSQAVYVNSDGKLGAQVSSRRFKDEIKPINQASEAIHRLRPVSFRYKAEVEQTRPVGFGLIAEEVEKINPDLVTRDKDGKPLSVRYDAVNAMLLNEFLKEHKKVEEQQATIADLKKAIAQLVAKHEERAAQIQKVSTQVQMSEPAAKVVLSKLKD
jgi:hypothetical protein